MLRVILCIPRGDQVTKSLFLADPMSNFEELKSEIAAKMHLDVESVSFCGAVIPGEYQIGEVLKDKEELLVNLVETLEKESIQEDPPEKIVVYVSAIVYALTAGRKQEIEDQPQRSRRSRRKIIDEDDLSDFDDIKKRISEDEISAEIPKNDEESDEATEEFLPSSVEEPAESSDSDSEASEEMESPGKTVWWDSSDECPSLPDLEPPETFLNLPDEEVDEALEEDAKLMSLMNEWSEPNALPANNTIRPVDKKRFDDFEEWTPARDIVIRRRSFDSMGDRDPRRDRFFRRERSPQPPLVRKERIRKRRPPEKSTGQNIVIKNVKPKYPIEKPSLNVDQSESAEKVCPRVETPGAGNGQEEVVEPEELFISMAPKKH